MASLIDVNVLVALMHERHQHAPAAANWVATQGEPHSIVICSVVQMGALRILTNPSILKDEVLSAAEFWRGWDRLIADDRFLKVHEASSLDQVWRKISATIPKGQRLETDVYLAAFAQSSQLTMATFDQGFRNFPDLIVEILEGSS